MASRVVPGISDTITRSRPSSLFTRLDLPTFGRPRIATRIASSGSSGPPGRPCPPRQSGVSSSRPPGPPVHLQVVEDLVQQVAGAMTVEPGDRDRVAKPETVQLEGERVLARV